MLQPEAAPCPEGVGGPQAGSGKGEEGALAAGTRARPPATPSSGSTAFSHARSWHGRWAAPGLALLIRRWVRLPGAGAGALQVETRPGVGAGLLSSCGERPWGARVPACMHPRGQRTGRAGAGSGLPTVGPRDPDQGLATLWSSVCLLRLFFRFLFLNLLLMLEREEGRGTDGQRRGWERSSHGLPCTPPAGNRERGKLRGVRQAQPQHLSDPGVVVSAAGLSVPSAEWDKGTGCPAGGRLNRKTSQLGLRPPGLVGASLKVGDP